MIINIIAINLFSIGIITILYNLTLFRTNMIYVKTTLVPYTKKTVLLCTILLLYNMMYYNMTYNPNTLGYQYIVEYLNIYWGIDSVSMILLSLIYILLPITILSNWNNIPYRYYSIYSILVLVLGILMALNFICIDIIAFYILFESTLAPLFILIGIYGSNNKYKASYYILIYTLYSSLYMLLSIALIYYIYNNSDYTTIANYILSNEVQSIIYIGIMIGIIVKTPLWPFHIWLPLAHSESPIGGSILLAGIVLKIAVYGIIRLILINVGDSNLLYIPIIYSICIISIVYIGIINIIKSDMKVIIAYSSIGHMAICIIGILSNNLIGMQGSLILCLSHGLISPGLFILVGAILYDRYHNRLVYYYQGLSTYMPIFSIYLLIYSLCNISLPLSGNFIGEILSFIGAYNLNPILTIIGTISILLSSVYQMKLTTKLIGGVKAIPLYIVKDMNTRETILLNILLIPTILLGVWPICITDLLDINLSSLLYNIV